MQERWTTVSGDGGVRLAVRVLEGPAPDAPDLLLHHGLASSQRIWDLMLPHLARRSRVVTFDARGHGRSAKPAAGYGFSHVTRDVRAVIRATRLRRPWIVGHSWGAMVALELAAADPGPIGGAVLVDGGLTTMRDEMDWPTARERLAPPQLAGMPVEEFRGMIRTFFADAVHVTPDVEDIVLSVMRVRPDGTIAPRLSRANHLRILRAIWEQRPEVLLGRVRVPTNLVLAQRRDASAEETAHLTARRAAARRVVAAGGGRVAVTWMEGIHDLPLQHPRALARRIERSALGGVG